MAAKSSGAKDEPEPKRSGFASQPYAGLIIGGVVTIVTALVANLLQSRAGTELERQKLESALIIKAVETLDPAVSSRNLCFLIKSGLIRDPEGKIAAASNPAEAPVFSTASGEPIRLNAAQRASFMDNYARSFGAADPAVRDRLREIFDYLEKNPDVSDVRTLAYLLATFRYETAGSFRPTAEIGSPEMLERRYGPETRIGRALGNTESGDGARWRGRGFVQVTGRRNYQRANQALGLGGTPDDVVADPDAMLRTGVAFRVAVWAINDGAFTRHKLSDFVTAEKADYVNARKVINGLDHAQPIAADAVKFEQMLKASMAPRATAQACAVPPRRG